MPILVGMGQSKVQSPMSRVLGLIFPWTLGFGLWAFSSAHAGILPSHEEPATFVVHPEYIPKGITIERCYYESDVVGPNTTFGFDINGSGFDEAFYKVITVDADALDVTIKNLTLVTANQIHGQIEVGPEATTQYIHPVVYIRSVPVFRAPEAFGVVRPGEVLDILLTSIDETGQWGKFRVITNLDDDLYSHFHVEPTNPRLSVSNVKAQYPFYVDGAIMIEDGLRHGQYGLITYMGKRELFRQDPIVDVVKPTVGKTGSIEKIEAVEMAHRPGDSLELAIKGSAFAPGVAGSLIVKVDGFDMGPSTVTYLSAGQLNATLRIPYNVPTGIYGASVIGKDHVLYEQPHVFAIVPPNWLSQVKLAAPLSPGKSGQVYLMGRDLTQDYAKKLELSTDTDGLKVSDLRWISPSQLLADISIDKDLAPGDYIIHVASEGKPVKLPRGDIIKVTP